MHQKSLDGSFSEWKTVGFFQVSRGLHQGFPLSPLLFIIVIESLSKKLEHERELGNLPRLQISRGVKNMNHSQFVDDTLFLGGASIIIASRFKSILDSFLDASGGAVNNIKSQIYGWHTSPRVMCAIA
jgi:hypothetical protein